MPEAELEMVAVGKGFTVTTIALVVPVVDEPEITA